MPTKFYLRNTTTGVSGTLPTDSANGPANQNASGATTLRTLSSTIGAGQTSAAVSTTATTGAQSSWFRSFVSDPLAAQTISAQTVAIQFGASESNASSDMFESGQCECYLWRPSSGAFVGGSLVNARIVGYFATELNEPSTSQTVINGSKTSTSRTCIDGDVLIVELFSVQSQSMGNSYTNTVFYDGTTEGSTSNIAAYINFTNDVALFVPPAEDTSGFIGGGFFG